MPVEVNPKETSRASAYELWMQAPNPMVTFFKTMNVTELIRTSRKRKLKFNMLMDYCIGKAAASVKEFYLLPVGDKLMRFDTIAIFCLRIIWTPLIVNIWIIPAKSRKPAWIGICHMIVW